MFSEIDGQSNESNDVLNVVNDVINAHKSLIESKGVEVVLDVEERLEVNYSEIHLSNVSSI